MAERQMFDMNSSVFEEDEMHRAIRDEENENKFIEENVEIISPENQQQKRRRCHRHTANQIQKMEEFFKDCPHPDKKQRSELGEEIGLEPLQVKFWFQNKRTQMKSKHERQENSHLRVENDKLQAENMKFREALMSLFCPSCGCVIAFGDVSLDDHHLRMENARLREEINCISAIAAEYAGNPFTNFADAPSSSAPCSADLGVAAVSIGKSSKGKEKAE